LPPTAAPEATATPLPAPTETPEPTAKPSDTPQPTSTTTPTPEATATATPTDTPQATEPTPEGTGVPGAVVLEPFTNETFGIQGLVPKGWREIGPGAYLRGSGATDVVTLIQQAAPGMSAQQLAQLLAQQTGIEALPESSGTIETSAFAWTLYEMEVPAAGMLVAVDVALAETGDAAYVVVLQALPDERETLHEAVFVPCVEALAPLGFEDEDAGKIIYRDPAGRFTVPVPTNWTYDEFDGYARLAGPDGEVLVYVLALDSDDLEAGIEKAWAMVDPAFDLEIEKVVDEPVLNGAERAITVVYDTGDDETIVIAGGWQHDGISYVELFRTNLEAYQRRASQLQIINSGYTITALEQTDLSDVEPLPLDNELLAKLEAYIFEKMEDLEVPGAAVAIVRDGEVVYARGFGVRDLDTRDPVTPETLMMIGSTTKPLTTLLMAHLVDQGAFDWDTRVVEILPDFRVMDPGVTEQITMRNMVCACTGVPRRDLEWLFNASELTAEQIIESLAEFEFFTDFGEAFQYSNQMVAAGGYLATLATGADYGDLYDSYVTLMQEGVFDPMGMSSTTFSFDEVQASGDYANPYGLTVLGDHVELELGIEAVLVPIGPAGALWSNVADMANYLITSLNAGVSPGGTRVASAENLAVTWQPQVDISADASYGLGWIVEDYEGVRVLSHGGNTFGFTSELAFLPDHGLGISVLTNQRMSALNQVVRFRLLDLLFEHDSGIDELLAFQLGQMEEARDKLSDSLEAGIDPDAAAAHLGTFENEDLGEVTLAWQGEKLVLDVGEFAAEIRARRTEEDEIEYFTFDPPLTGIPLEFGEDDDGQPALVLGVGLVEYTFNQVQ
jgi:CubicO group peptidase (beta-lactamase class C family)